MKKPVADMQKRNMAEKKKNLKNEDSYLII